MTFSQLRFIELLFKRICKNMGIILSLKCQSILYILNREKENYFSKFYSEKNSFVNPCIYKQTKPLNAICLSNAPCSEHTQKGPSKQSQANVNRV